MIDLYRQLAQRISTISQIRHIAWDNNELNDTTNSPSFSAPAVFIGCNIKWNNALADKQEGTALIKIRLLIRATPEDTRYTSQNRNHFLQSLSIMPRVHRKLQGFNGDDFGSLMRTKTETEDSYPSTMVISLSYECLVWEILVRSSRSASLSPTYDFTNRLGT